MENSALLPVTVLKAVIETQHKQIKETEDQRDEDILLHPAQIREIVSAMMSVDINDPILHDLRVTKLSGGITNSLLRIRTPAISDNASTQHKHSFDILLRVDGDNTDQIINRDREFENMRTFHSAGLGPRIYGRFGNGIVYAFIDATPITLSQMGDKEISRGIARQLGKWHSANTLQKFSNQNNGSHDVTNASPSLFPTIRKFAEILPASYYSTKWNDFDFNQILRVVDTLEQRVIELTSKDPMICICHNDLLYGNILYGHNTKTAKFIDYEYSTLNYAVYDLAKSFL